MRPILTAVLVLLVGGKGLFAQDAASGAGGSSENRWEIGLVPSLQTAWLEGEEAERAPSVNVQAGYVLTDWTPSLGEFSFYGSAAANVLRRSGPETELSIFTGDLGIQLAARVAGSDLRLVVRVAAGLLHTAEILAGDQLTRYSGLGHSAGLAVRYLAGGSGCLELGVMRSKGRYRTVELLDRLEYTAIRGPADMGYTVWRVGLGLFL